MHERSLVRSLLKQVQQLCTEHAASEVAEIEVEIGPLSGVEPLLVREAFDMLSKDSVGGAAQLMIREIPLRGQ